MTWNGWGADQGPAGRPLLMVLAPLGEYDLRALGRLAGDLTALLRADISVGPPAALPPAAYDARRGQYQAADLLALVRSLAPREAGVVLGVAEADLYAKNLNFVFGQAHLGGREAVISLARLRPEYYGEPADPDRLARRALTEAVHELGHVLGAEHCANPHCVMFFSHQLPESDRKGPLPCPRCRHYYPLVDQPAAP